MADILKPEQTLLAGSIPAISGIEDPAQARMLLYQAGRPVHAPMDQVGLLTNSSMSMSTVATDASFTFTPGTTSPTIRHTGTLTANRTITLATTGAVAGQSRLKVTRTGSGAFTLSVGGLKALSTNQWCEAVYDGSAWYLAAYGTL